MAGSAGGGLGGPGVQPPVLQPLACSCADASCLFLLLTVGFPSVSEHGHLFRW